MVVDAVRSVGVQDKRKLMLWVRSQLLLFRLLALQQHLLEICLKLRKRVAENNTNRQLYLDKDVPKRTL